MPWYDNIPERPLEPPPDKPSHICAQCQEELFPGDKIYSIPYGPVCSECFDDWIRDLLATSPSILADQLGVDVEDIHP